MKYIELLIYNREVFLVKYQEILVLVSFSLLFFTRMKI
jgi:hypothetical protein